MKRHLMNIWRILDVGVGVYLMRLREGGVFGRWHHECLNVYQKLTR